MASTVVLKALGLNTQPNQLDVQDGSMTEASNVIIKRDNVVESRRGFKLFGDDFGGGSDRAKQLLTYKNIILRHYDDTLQFQVSQGSESFSSFSGSFSEPVAGIRIKGVEANGNFYFTSDTGIKKISAKTVGGLSTASGFITNAGGVKALDTKAYLSIVLGDSSGFLPADSAVAYRIVWGIKDANSNLILGTPSQRAEVYNPLSSLIAQDLNNLLKQLDNVGYSNTGTLSGTTYLDTYGVDYSADGSTLKTQVVALASGLDNDILLNPTNATITAEVFTGGLTAQIVVTSTLANHITAGDHVALSGFTAPTLTQLNGQFFTVTSISGGTTLNLTLYPDDATPLTPTAGAIADVNGVINSYNYRYITVTGSVDFPTSLVDTVIDTPTTHDELATIHDTIERFMARLQVELSGVIDNTAKTTFIDPLAITTTANVILEFTIPDDVTTSHFYQIYRSSIVQATGTTVLSDLTPSDELQLVYEAFPTSADLSAQRVIVEDVTPDQFRGANLYTNAGTGEGILQANDVPPFAVDINRFKNYTFYANTRTRHRFSLNMLGVQQLLDAYTGGVTPTITIANGSGFETFKFVTGVQEETDIDVVGEAGINPGEYFTLNSANDIREYYFWYRVNGTGSDPAVAGKTGVVIDILTGDADTVVATKTRDAINAVNIDFSATAAGDIVSVTNIDEGPCTDATAGTTAFVVSVTQQGQGEDAANNEVLLSQLPSVARAVDATARSLVSVINQSTASIYAYYLSGATDVPGKMLFESKELETTENPFYVLANSESTGTSFNPILTPDLTVDTGASITADSPSVGQVTLDVTGHGLATGDEVLISGSFNSSPSVDIDGIYTITVIDANSFWITASIAGNATVTADSIGISYLPDVQVSDNEVKPNRVYFSKLQQPEAVPLVNFLDVGAEDKEILRIFPLRDSLFVFKEDGLYRISGEVSPFTLALFDGSCQLLAPDSLGLLNNVVYGWTEAGIDNITESGVSTISRPIDIDILPKASDQYTNFSSATWGIGYESDNSYLVWTVVNTTDTVGMIAYRFSNLTNTWTTYDKTNTCGIVGPDGKLYLGAGDTNYIEQERKTFDRTDYADRELEKALVSNSFNPSTPAVIQFTDVADFEEGDVITQEQLLTVYEFNALLQKLDIDPGVGDDDYYETLAAVQGDNLRDKLDALATKLDADPAPGHFTDYADRITAGAGPYSLIISSVTTGSPATVTTAADHYLQTGRFINIVDVTTNASITGTQQITRTGATTFTVPVNVVSVTDGAGSFTRLEQTFEDIQICFNIIVNRLNADPAFTFTNYAENDTTTLMEVVVTGVNRVTKRITVNSALDFVIGPITLYKHIPTAFTYAPQTMQDPLGFKHIREATVMFQNKAFSSATISFATDLLPAFIPVDFSADSNGIFGMGGFFGQGFFGGASNSAPFRTYIPGPCQRCRYIVMKFEHAVAREMYSIYGATLTGETGLSSRAYK